MTHIVIITLCLLVLISYVFEISASKTRVPGVILLLVLGIILQVIVDRMGWHMPDLKGVLPVIGAIGLILIVLEGSLELEVTKENIGEIKKPFFVAMAAMTFFCAIFGFIGYYALNLSFNDTMLNVIPLSVISSAVAIPAVQNLSSSLRGFIVYESSISDILGIVFFNFFLVGNNYLYSSVLFLANIVIIVLISVVACLILGFLLNKISHHIKTLPMITLLILVYSIAKLFHLPALILILVFGIFLNNSATLFGKFRYINLVPVVSADELKSFKHMAGEFAFFVRAFFFIMFGYYTDVNLISDPIVLLIAAIVVFAAVLSRGIILKIFNAKNDPFVYIAPRGLITILLFYSIPESSRISLINDGMLSGVIFLSVIIMMYGLMKYKKPVQGSL